MLFHIDGDGVTDFSLSSFFVLKDSFSSTIINRLIVLFCVSSKMRKKDIDNSYLDLENSTQTLPLIKKIQGTKVYKT